MDEASQNAPTVVKALVQAMSALAGAGIGGPPGAVVGAVSSELMLELAAKAWRELGERRASSVGRLVEQASDACGQDPEVMLSDAAANEGTAQLLLDAMAAASETLLEWKVDALGKALAGGLAHDSARVDEERLVVRALADLEPPHVRALSLLARARKPLTMRTIEANVGLTDAGAVMPVLVRHGLAEEPRKEGLTVGDGPVTWETTRFGRRVLKYLGGPGFGFVFFHGGER